jgi:NAD dependent epimerase/dehydratase family enzyme
MPSFVVKLLFGEMGNELFLFSRKVYPKKLLDNGFKFSFENIKEAFNNLYK